MLPALDLITANDGDTTGTSLWPAARALACYIHHTYANKNRSLTVCELGSGTGFTALCVASMNWRVLATDTKLVIDKVLSHNVQRNAASAFPGTVQIRELDWECSPDDWTWDDPQQISISSAAPPASCDLPESSKKDTISPPFDLIFTSDTLYVPSLLEPLLRTIYALCTHSSPCSLILVALERRDPPWIDQALETARTRFGFTTQRVSHRRVVVAVTKAGIEWDKAWEDVEIWKFALKFQGPKR